MAAEAQRASQRDRGIASAARRLIAAVEPWYMWGWIGVERLQEVRTDDGGRIQSGGEGEVAYFEIQWFGVHLQIQLGRTPKAVRS